jgi:uncharacterized protein (TIGR03435 family)
MIRPAGFFVMLCVAFAASAVFSGQSPAPAATFEVASIRRSNPEEVRSGFANRPGGRFVATNVTARELVATAYHLEHTRVIDGQACVDTDRFAIEALAFENAKP